MGTFFVGCDLGQAQDYSALIVCEAIDDSAYNEADIVHVHERYERRAAMVQPDGFEVAPALYGEGWVRKLRLPDGTLTAVPESGTAQTRYEVRHIQRWPLNTSYPAIVRGVGALMATPELRGQTLVADATGVGRPVIDLLYQVPDRAFTLVPVLIHGGDATTRDDRGYVHCPKRSLVSTVAVLLQAKRLKFAAGLPHVDTLTKELLSFQVKIDMTTAHDSYGAWREGQHDDLVLALALALWHAERHTPVTFQWLD